jgi:hypothetical protein
MGAKGHFRTLAQAAYSALERLPADVASGRLARHAENIAVLSKDVPPAEGADQDAEDDVVDAR